MKQIQSAINAARFEKLKVKEKKTDVPIGCEMQKHVFRWSSQFSLDFFTVVFIQEEASHIWLHMTCLTKYFLFFSH